MNTNLTDLETKALKALQANSRYVTGSEMSFGIVEEVKWSGSRKQLGGLLSSLQAKGVVEVFDPHRVDKYLITQFALADEYKN